jgi:competence protein ComGC
MDFWMIILIVILSVMILMIVIPFLIYVWSKAQMAGWLTTFLRTLEDHKIYYETRDEQQEEEDDENNKWH